MTIRKRNDDKGYERGAKGIDGNLGSDFTSRPTSPWSPNPRGDYLSSQGAGKYQDKSASFLTNKMPDENTRDEDPLSGARDIWSQVENQSSDSGNRAVKSGSKD